jgi:hypothetical protein
MSSWHSYSSIYNLGHAALTDLLKGPVYVEEKIDGSQFSFCLTEEGELRVRSKGCEMVVEAPEKMFTKAVETVKRLRNDLHPGWTYRCEYLAKPKHNVLAYNRAPAQHLIVFDIEISECRFLNYSAKQMEANRIGLETVPLLWEGIMAGGAFVRSFLLQDSVLGGQKIEGIVIKPVFYNLFGKDKEVLMGKFVSEAFKETHAHVWKTENPTTGDMIANLGAEYNTQARWQKAIQHLAEKGLITDSPQDIAALIKEVPADIKRECEEEIKEKLFAFAWPKISRGIIRGLPEWYKELLLKKQFEGVSNEETTNEETSGC